MTAKSGYLILLAGLCLAALVPFGAYLLYFDAYPPALRGTIDEWGQLGSFLSGTTGAILGLANVCAVLFVAWQVQHWGEQGAKKTMAASVLSEWGAPTMLRARIDGAKFIRLVRISIMQSPKKGQPFNAINPWVPDGRAIFLDFVHLDAASPDNMLYVHTVSSYFERVALLTEGGYLDESDVRRLVGPSWAWWWHYALQHWPTAWEGNRTRHRKMHQYVSGTDDYSITAPASTEFKEWLRLAQAQLP